MTPAVTALRTQYPLGLLGVPAEGLRLHWAATGRGPAQEAYQLRWTSQTGTELGPVVESTESLDVPAPGGPLASAERRAYAVRIRDHGVWSPWSDDLEVEGELRMDEIEALAIGHETPLAGPAALLRTEFELPAGVVRARLRATSHGIHEIRINGHSATDEHLAPGWTPYGERLLLGTWDVTDLLRSGRNAIAAVLGDGWFRGRLGANDETAHYGTRLALLAQLDVELGDGTELRFGTDTSWRASTGAVRAQSLYDGCDTDLRLVETGWDWPGFDDAGWVQAEARSIDASTLRSRSALGVRAIERLHMRQTSRNGTTVLDAGQNISGWVRLRVRGSAGEVVRLRHAEVLEADGTLHTRALRGARATDTFVLAKDGESVLEPQLTFHGFRYAEVLGAEVIDATAVAISSAHGERSSFSSSEPLLDRFHQNTLWSLRDNFLALPTDCPQRDERLGWTGDAQAFAPTSSILADTAAFWGSWLQDLEIEQSDEQGVPAVVPNVLPPFEAVVDGVPQLTMGRSGWGDAAVLVPWAVYEAFGSTEVLERQLPSMRRWIEHLERRAGQALLLPEEFQFGDWLDPDAPAGRPWLAKAPAGLVANVFYAHSVSMLARVEELVGDASRAVRALELRQRLATSIWQRWEPDFSRSQTAAALALRFGLCPPAQRVALQETLAALVREADGRIATGFLGTPHVLHALSDGGHVNEAYQMLLRREAPSWLYQVEQGATTVWERWDALLPDGTIHPGDFEGGDRGEGGSMLSFNHYAYGAVLDWVYRHVAGIAPTPDDPGYRTVIVAPRPTRSVVWARGSIGARLGRVAIDWAWSEKDDELRIQLTVPYGARAVLDLPTTERSLVRIGGVVSTSFELTAGRHDIRVSVPLIAQRVTTS